MDVTEGFRLEILNIGLDLRPDEFSKVILQKVIIVTKGRRFAPAFCNPKYLITILATSAIILGLFRALVCIQLKLRLPQPTPKS